MRDEPFWNSGEIIATAKGGGGVRMRLSRRCDTTLMERYSGNDTVLFLEQRGPGSEGKENK
jgi:hypothetical protein